MLYGKPVRAHIKVYVGPHGVLLGEHGHAVNENMRCGVLVHFEISESGFSPQAEAAMELSDTS